MTKSYRYIIFLNNLRKIAVTVTDQTFFKLIARYVVSFHAPFYVSFSDCLSIRHTFSSQILVLLLLQKDGGMRTL